MPLPSLDVLIRRTYHTSVFYVNFSRTASHRGHVAAYDWFYSDAAVGLSSALPINPIQKLTRTDGDGRVDCSFSC